MFNKPPFHTPKKIQKTFSTHQRLSLLVLFSSSLAVVQVVTAEDNTTVDTLDALDEITVTTDFRPVPLDETGISVTVIPKQTVQERAATHIEDVLNMAPNVNMSSGASRAHYFQIRGIGERSQFETPINPSVGLYIDGMDFSRSGASATLFDVEQIEIVRGPQGTRYGANALAGILNLYTTEPGESFSGHVETGIGNYGQSSFGIAIGGPIIDNKLLGRTSFYTNQSDGYITNQFLDRDNTNKRDEITAKGHLKWLATDDLTVDLRYLHLDINNGYDAFTFDNSRNTLSDEPGRDTQKTDAVSLEADWLINPAVKLEAAASYSDSDLEYSYDEDWSYVGQFEESLYPYSSFDQYLRSRKNRSLEARLLSDEQGRIFNDKSDWVVGVYHSAKSEDLVRNYTYLDSPFLSQYDTTSTALYGQLDTELTAALNLITGLRAEQWDADYSDSDKQNINTDELLYGGKLGFEYQINDSHLGHASVSRGYKAGGVNTDGTLPKEFLDFGTEYLWNFEVGLNSSLLDDALNTRLTAFYAKRKDLQVKSSLVTPREDGSTDFTDFIGNAAKGNNYGLEAELDWQVSEKLKLTSSLGLLQATFDEYRDPQSLENGLNLSGRDQAHAPNWQYHIGADYTVTPALTAAVNLEGKDGFYFSDRHNARAKSYHLVNASLTYKKGDWTTTLWGRNLFDKDYDVRGFGSFGNNPGNGYEVETYTQKGEPRVFGINVAYDFD